MAVEPTISVNTNVITEGTVGRFSGRFHSFRSAFNPPAAPRSPAIWLVMTFAPACTMPA